MCSITAQFSILYVKHVLKILKVEIKFVKKKNDPKLEKHKLFYKIEVWPVFIAKYRRRKLFRYMNMCWKL